MALLSNWVQQYGSVMKYRLLLGVSVLSHQLFDRLSWLSDSSTLNYRSQSLESYPIQ